MKTINLLPKIRQQELGYEAVFRSLLTVFILTLLSFALIFLAQLGVKFYLEEKVSLIKAEITQLTAQVNQQDSVGLKKKIQNINGITSDFNSLAAASPKWSRVFEAFAPLPPPGVGVANFAINAQQKTIDINGYSPTRELVIQLYNNLVNDDKEFYNVNYPLDNLVKETNVNFHFTFSIRDSLLK